MSFAEVFKSEVRMVFTDIAIVLTIIGGVILYSFLYPQPYAKESASELPVSVVDLDGSDISRDMIFKLDATPQIDIYRMDNSQKDAKKALVEGKVKAIVVIPNDFKKDLALGHSPTVAIGADASYFLIYGGVLEGAMKSVLTKSATIKVANLLKKQIPLSGAKERYTSCGLNIINLFNPKNSYTQYVIPAVFVLILQQTMLIGLGILGGGVNEARERRGETWMVMLSRIIIFGSIFFVHMLFYFGFSFDNYFHISHLADISDLLIFGSAFILDVVFFGIFLGSLFSSREIATPVILFSSLLLVFSAGFVWPLQELPNYVVWLSNMIPSTPAISGFLKLNQMGADFYQIKDEFNVIIMQMILYLFLSFYMLKRDRNR